MEKWVTAFQQRLKDDTTVATAVSAIATLVDFIKENEGAPLS